MLRRIYPFIVFFMLSSAAFCAESGCTFEIQGSRIENNETYTGHGTAVAVDLTAYGLPGKHYLLTCAHLVDGYTDHRILVATKIRPCRIVWKDDELDLCVLRCEAELPEVVSLAADDLGVKDKFTTIGYPEGQKSKVLQGTVTKKNGILREAEIAGFEHGCSGSGLFSNGKLAGLATGFVANSAGTALRDTAFFVPAKRIEMFLLYSAIHKE